MKNIEVGHVIGDLPETGDFKRPTKLFFFQNYISSVEHGKITRKTYVTENRKVLRFRHNLIVYI